MIPQADLPLTFAAGPLGWVYDLFYMDRGRSTHSLAGDELFLGIFYLSTFFFVVLMVLMVYWAVKYRRRPGTIAPPSPAHNTVLEILWTVVPLGILAVIFFKGYRGYLDHIVAPAGAIELNLTAQKWDWLITYPDGETSPLKKKVGDKDVPVFVVPANIPIKLRMNSIDVMHSFWVPAFRSKFDVMPNRYTTYWFEANAPAAGTVLDDGTPYEDHWVFCAEYCGDSHSEMAAIVRVVPEEAYRKTLKSWGVEGLPPVEYGKRLHATRCASCHSADGKPGTGPTWKDLYGETHDYADGSKILADDNFIRESILEPGKKIRAGFPNQMVSFQGVLGEKEIAAILSYMKSISVKGGGDAGAAPADAPASGEKK